MKAIFHIHTRNSYDSLLKPREIVNYAIKNKIDVLFITDHDTIKGALDVKDYVKKRGLNIKVIIGAEYKSNIGDITGLFLKKEVISRDYKELIKEIKKQGGMVVLNHPFCGHDLNRIKELTNKEVDFVEVFNSRCSVEKNKKALDFAIKKRMKKIYGSDAHLRRELGNVIIEFDSIGDFKNGRIRVIREKYTKKYLVYLSQMIKGVKTKNPLLFFRSTLKSLLFFIIQK